MKLIFLDIDGPLAYETWELGKVEISTCTTINYPLNKESCESLARIIEATDAKIIISSDWKYWYTLKQLNEILEYYDIPGVAIGVTHHRKRKLSSAYANDRAYQIITFVNDFKDSIDSWIAIDDFELANEFKFIANKYSCVSEINAITTIGDNNYTIKDTLCDLEKKIITILNGKN